MTQFYSKRDLKFQLFELIKADELNQIEYFQDHNRETFEMILEAADQIAQKSLRPLLTEMDRNEPQLENGKIKIHPGMKSIIHVERFNSRVV